MTQHKNPTITIIMPVYNSAEFLQETLAYILAQSYKDFELLAIDDGSTDNSLGILNDVAKQNSVLRVITSKNSGAGAARNKGLDLASGKYICFVDSDDVPTKNYLLTLLRLIEDSKSDLACIKHVSFKKTLPEEHLSDQPNKVLSAPEASSRLLLEKISAAPHCKIYKKEFLSDLRFENFSIAEDLYFNYLYLKHCEKVVVSQACCYGYRRNNNGLSRSTFNPRRMDGLKATKLINEDSHSEESTIRYFMEAEYILEAIARSGTYHPDEVEKCKEAIIQYRSFILESSKATKRQKTIAKASYVSPMLIPKLAATKNRITR